MKQAKLLNRRLRRAEVASSFRTPFGMLTSTVEQYRCRHEWEADGQTVTATRWTCLKCGKSELRG